jgi:hypothetical protein
MRIAQLASTQGFHFAFDPSTTGSKRGDVRVAATRDEPSAGVVVECTSHQYFPKIVQETDRIHWRLWPPTEWEGLRIGGNLARPVDMEELDHLAVVATAFYEHVQNTGKPGEIEVDGILTLWAVPEDHPDADRFAEARDNSRNVQFNYDPFQRLVAVVRKKQGQLPKDGSAVIALRPSGLITRQRQDAVRGALRAAMETEPRIAAVALSSRLWGPLVIPRAHDLSYSDHFAIAELYYPWKEVTLLIWNPSRLRRDSDALIRQLFIPDLEPWVDI